MNQQDDIEWLRQFARVCMIHTVRDAISVNFENEIAHRRLCDVADRLSETERLRERVRVLERALGTCSLAAMAVSESLNPDLRAALPAIQAALSPEETG